MDGNGVALSAHIWLELAGEHEDEVCCELERWIDIAAKSNVHDLICHGGSVANQVEGIERVCRVLKRVEPLCAAKHVFLNIENHYPYDYRSCRELFSDSWEFVGLFCETGEQVRFCLDTVHANMTGNLLLLIGSLAPWLRYIHIADNMGVDDDHLTYEKGSVQWSSFWTALAQVGFEGIVCLEFPIVSCDDALKKCVANTRRIPHLLK